MNILNKIKTFAARTATPKTKATAPVAVNSNGSTVYGYASGENKHVVGEKLTGRLEMSDYADLAKDPKVASMLLYKTLAVTSDGWDIVNPERAQDDFGDDVLDAVMDALDGVPDFSFYEALNSLIRNALTYGVGLAEKVWAWDETRGLYVLRSLNNKDPRAFEFIKDDYGNLKSLKMRDRHGKEHEFKPSEFVIFHHGEILDGIGTSDIEYVRQRVFAKRKTWGFFQSYVERCAHPGVVAKVPQAYSEEEQKALADALKAFTEGRINAMVCKYSGADTGNNIEIDYVAPQHNHGPDFLDGISAFNNEIALGILGQTLTSENGGGTGSYALGKVHADVLSQVLRNLKKEVEEVVNKSIVADIMKYNYGSAQCPQFKLQVSLDDLETLASVLTKLATSGIINPNEEWIREKLNLPENTMPDGIEINEDLNGEDGAPMPPDPEDTISEDE